MRFVMEFSLDATDTMLEGADPVEGTAHKNEAPFQDRLKALYGDVGLPLNADMKQRRERHDSITRNEDCRSPPFTGFITSRSRPTIWRRPGNSGSTSSACANFRGRISDIPARGWAARSRAGLRSFTSMPADRHWGRKARRRRARRRSIMSRCPAPAIAPMSRASRRPVSTGANSSCPARRSGNCSSMIPAAFSSN